MFVLFFGVWLFPVMNNSEKNERIEKAQSLILYRSDIEYSDKCINNLDLFLKNGTYETFQQVNSIDYYPKCTYFTFQYHCYKINTFSRFILKTFFHFILSISLDDLLNK